MSAEPKFPKRGENSRWSNDEPITDLNEALSFLASEETSSEPHHLRNRDYYDGKTDDPWELIAPWFTSGSSGGDSSGHDYYQIDQALAERLIKERFVTPYLEKYWGGSTPLPNKLVITNAAKARIKAFEEELRLKARTFLTSGIHTDLTGEPNSAGWGRDGWRCGRFYCDFRAPGGAVCRVYPESGELIFPYALAREHA